MRYLVFILLLLLNIAAGTSTMRFSKKAPKVEPGFVVPYQQIIMREAGDRWVDRAAQLWSESNFDTNAVSYVGAKGLGQFMDPTWAQWAPKGSNPFNPELNIRYNHKYMLLLEARCERDLDASVASYNCGLGNVRKAQRLAKSLGLEQTHSWKVTLPRITGKFSNETLTYVKRNAQYRELIRNASIK